MTTDLTMTDVLDTLEFLGACSEGTHSVRAYVDPEAALRGAAIERTLWLWCVDCAAHVEAKDW